MTACAEKPAAGRRRPDGSLAPCGDALSEGGLRL